MTSEFAVGEKFNFTTNIPVCRWCLQRDTLDVLLLSNNHALLLCNVPIFGGPQKGNAVEVVLG